MYYSILATFNLVISQLFPMPPSRGIGILLFQISLLEIKRINHI